MDRKGITAWSVIEPYWEAVDIYGSESNYLRGLAKLPEKARGLLPVHWCDSEVCNGGFHQFFSNSTGIVAPEALAAYRAIGADRCAAILERAMNLFPGRYPRDREERVAALASIELPGEERQQWDPFYAFDDEYYAAKPGLDRLMDDYARSAS